MDAEKALQDCPCICSHLHYIPKHFCFSSPAFLPKRINNCSCSFSILHLSAPTLAENSVEMRDTNMPLCSSPLKKHACVSKPLWWAHTSSACKPVVNNRCLTVHVAALCSFRESDTFSSPCNSFTWYWIIEFVCSINALLSHHMSLYLFGWKFGLR